MTTTATKPRVGIMGITLCPDTMSEEARREAMALFIYFRDLAVKEGVQTSDTIDCLYDYFAKTQEGRAASREKIARANLGYGIDTHIHILYKLDDHKPRKSLSSLIQFESIVGYVCFYDDGNLHNPVIYIGDRFVIREYDSNGFFRSVVNNLMASNKLRVPLYKTDIRTDTADDIRLYVSLGFNFVRPYNTQEITIKEAHVLSKAFISTVEKEINLDVLMYTYPQLLDTKYKIFQMILVSNCCHTCNKIDVAFQTCTRCQSVNYCSPECHKKAWSTHKKVCTPTRI